MCQNTRLCEQLKRHSFVWLSISCEVWEICWLPQYLKKMNTSPTYSIKRSYILLVHGNQLPILIPVDTTGCSLSNTPIIYYVTRAVGACHNKLHFLMRKISLHSSASEDLNFNNNKFKKNERNSSPHKRVFDSWSHNWLVDSNFHKS